MALWPTILDVIIEALEDIASCKLVNCCDHIQVACSSLVATNGDMKKKLEKVKSVFPDLTKIYARTIEEKISMVTPVRESLVEALADGFSLMEKMHDWFGILTLKNQPIHPL